MKNPQTEKYIPVRDALLELHRSLLVYEKARYESVYGTIKSSNEYLGLVMDHASFKWLRQLSELIVLVDEMIEAKELWSEEKTKTLLMAAQMLLVPNEVGSEFQQKYHAATQTSPEATMKHGQVMIELKKLI